MTADSISPPPARVRPSTGTVGLASSGSAERRSRVGRDEIVRVALFRTELRHFLSRTETASKEAGLTPQRYDLLLMIESAYHSSGIRLTDLCDLLQLKQPAVTELVNRAVETGLVERRRSTLDRRGRLLTLTPEGKRRLLLAFNALRDDRATLAARFEGLDLRFHATAPDPIDSTR